MALAREDGAALAVVHVIETHPMYMDFAPPAAIDLHAWTEQASAGLHALVPEKVRAICNVTEVVREGRPYREILGLARELDADLIVLGVHGRAAADLFFFGSTTHHVVREAHCAVLTLRD
jgi:nucleotide-binding universal stress UspA family protein